ncbi:hypothetical protein C8T65DRAFT_654552 [Cerioporus squamosus]|nr:hypothetical protein C8T65DRAFT_654552 [Cerioporus squamosus]
MQLVSSLAVVAAMAVAAHAAAVATPLIINTPAAAIQCSPTQLTWTGGAAPFSLSILDASGAVIETFSDVTGQSFTWDTNVPGGESVDVELEDSTGAAAFTAPFEILVSLDTACL